MMDQNKQPALTTLAADIRDAHAKAIAAATSAIEHAIDAGRLLAEAKAQVEHGAWLPWLAANVPDIIARTA
jgi:hypothetical protein